MNNYRLDDIIMYVDEHTNSDQEFYEQFTKAIFKEYDTTFYSKSEIDDISDRAVQQQINMMRGK